MRKIAGKSGVPPKQSALVSAAEPEAQISSFIAKFDPKMAALIRSCRRELRRQLPTAVELVYDNYNFFVIGYASTDRASDCIVSLAAAANGVGLSFYYGAKLKDPNRLLQGTGKQNRYIRLAKATALREGAVSNLICSAVANGKTALPRTGRGHTIVKSISKKQRPRRKDTDAT